MLASPDQSITPVTPNWSLHLQLEPRMQVWSATGANILPRSKKARALLALIALSDARVVSRQQAAALLWSNLERTIGLARLRDTLHNLQKEFRDAGIEALALKDAAISFKANAVLVKSESATANQDYDRTASEFLMEFDGIDPAFDQWLTRTRERRYQQGALPLPGRPASRQEAARTASRGGPSVVITALEAVGGRAEEQFTRGLAEEIGTALARLRWFSVITRGRDGRRLSSGSDNLFALADYALTGTLQQDKGSYRLSIKLIDLENCAIAWAAAFVQEKEGSFVAQERFAASIAACMDTELLVIEAHNHRRNAPLRRSDAYSLVLQAVPAIHRLERDPFLGAGHALEQAVAIDRELAMAHSWLAYWHVFLVGQGWALNPAQSMTRAGRAADRAIMLDPKDARGVTVAGHVKAFLSRRLDEAAALHELALQLNPAMALAWHFAGVTHAYAGRLPDADHCISHCRDLAPADPHGFFAEAALGIVRLLQKDHEAAAIIGRRVTERHPHFTSAFKSYLSALGHLGQKAEAAVVLNRLRLLEPRFSLQRFHSTAPYQRSEDLEHYTAGLRLAGLN